MLLIIRFLPGQGFISHVLNTKGFIGHNMACLSSHGSQSVAGNPMVSSNKTLLQMALVEDLGIRTRAITPHICPQKPIVSIHPVQTSPLSRSPCSYNILTLIARVILWPYVSHLGLTQHGERSTLAKMHCLLTPFLLGMWTLQLFLPENLVDCFTHLLHKEEHVVECHPGAIHQGLVRVPCGQVSQGDGSLQQVAHKIFSSFKSLVQLFSPAA